MAKLNVLGGRILFTLKIECKTQQKWYFKILTFAVVDLASFFSNEVGQIMI